LPSHKTVIAERFFDQAGGMQFVLHAPFGSRITRAWGLALRKRFCRTFNFELQAAATDDGLVLSLSDQYSFPLDLVFAFLKSASVEDVLRQALLTAPMFGARWRWNATRALAILRFQGGKRVPTPIQRMRSDDLLAAVFPDQVACAENLTGPIRIPDHPLVKETIDNCMFEAMDLEGLRQVLRGIEDGTIRTKAIDTAQASPFSHEILNANPYAFLDDAPLEERRTRAVQLRQTLGTDVTGGEGILDPAVIAEISAEVWPEARDADELHDALLTLIRLPPVRAWQTLFDELSANGRASVVTDGDYRFWVATERESVKDDPNAVVSGWMESSGPVTASELESKVGFPREEIESALLRLESRGQVLRGRFRNAGGETEWCNRRILARIHRATLGRLRREIEPVTALDFEGFLQAWQHVSPGTQLHGADGTLHIIRQLEGYEIAAASWELEILARRVAKYDPGLLDELCFSGEVMWARVSPHPAIAENRRVRPTRIAPVTLFLREDAEWLMSSKPTFDPASLSHPAQDVLSALERNGASFFIDLVRQTHRLQSEVEDGLWELLAGGFVTADGFDNLRALIDPKRRRGEGREGKRRPRNAAGRWALLHHVSTAISHSERVERFARQLLMRWGVLLRDLLVRETLAPPWRDLLPVLRRMEARGEIRGGRFVSGFTGEQFALPEALELLRSMRRAPEKKPLVPVFNTDPLNLAGIILPGPRVTRIAAAGLVPA
jgi:ATP-dependent helicase Lhr and Lhr-like helicase